VVVDLAPGFTGQYRQLFNKKARAAPAFFVSASQRRIATRRIAARFVHAVRAGC
jgi:hypothetical protein